MCKTIQKPAIYGRLRYWLLPGYKRPI